MLDTLIGEPPTSQLKFRSTSEELPRVHRPTWAELSRGFIKPQRPVVIEGLIDEWPALELWTPDYFDRLLLGGRRRADDAPGRKSSDYWLVADLDKPCDASVEPLNAHYTVPFLAPPAHGLRRALRWNGPPTAAQVDALRLWYGPPGASLLNIHFDAHHNFVANIFGRKHFLLFPPEEKRYLYIEPWYTGHDFSRLRTLGAISERYPLLARARSMEVTLEPGEVLFLPSFWWHNVHAATVSITLSMFWDIPAIFYRTRIRPKRARVLNWVRPLMRRRELAKVARS